MLTRSQINRAGRRLRKAETPDEADRQIYDEFRATFAEPLGEVVEALRGVAGGAPVTYRLKRFETTVEAQGLKALAERLEAVAALGSDDSDDAPEYLQLLTTLKELQELTGDA